MWICFVQAVIESCTCFHSWVNVLTSNVLLKLLRCSSLFWLYFWCIQYVYFWLLLDAFLYCIYALLLDGRVDLWTVDRQTKAVVNVDVQCITATHTEAKWHHFSKGICYWSVSVARVVPISFAQACNTCRVLLCQRYKADPGCHEYSHDAAAKPWQSGTPPWQCSISLLGVYRPGIQPITCLLLSWSRPVSSDAHLSSLAISTFMSTTLMMFTQHDWPTFCDRLTASSTFVSTRRDGLALDVITNSDRKVCNISVAYISVATVVSYRLNVRRPRLTLQRDTRRS